MASGGVAAAVFIAAVVFGTSLATSVSTPAAYGWPWDVAAMVAAGPAIPLGWVAATVAGGAAVALLAAALPARVAARVDPAAALRSE